MRRCCYHVFAVVAIGLGLPASVRGGGEEDQNKALAHRVFREILNQRKYDVFEEIYSKDFVKHVDGRNESLDQEIRDAMSMHVASSDLLMTIDLMIAEGDKVAILYTGRGTNDGPFGKLPATGKKLVVSGMTLYRFKNGMIVEEWTAYNELEVLRHLGYFKNMQSVQVPAK